VWALSLDTTLPSTELKRRSLVTQRAHAAAAAPDFSQLYQGRPAAAVDPLCKANGFAWRRQLGRERLVARSEQYKLHGSQLTRSIAGPVAPVAAC
jgi:hypothetical protein